jgi:hypothetical protein
VGRLLLIDGVSAVALVAVWYWCFTRYNHRKAAQALLWVESACSGIAEVAGTHWLGACRVQANLQFASHWFEDARITVRLLPRPIPMQWLLSLWRRQKETLTFEADLDTAPSFRLEVFRHRWLTQNHSSASHRMGNWTVSRPGPVILTTRTEWSQELTPVVNTLMTSRGQSLVTVRFRPESPHMAATVALDTLSDAETAVAFLGVLRDLAAGASTSRQ